MVVTSFVVIVVEIGPDIFSLMTASVYLFGGHIQRDVFCLYVF